MAGRPPDPTRIRDGGPDDAPGVRWSGPAVPPATPYLHIPPDVQREQIAELRAIASLSPGDGRRWIDALYFALAKSTERAEWARDPRTNGG
jgi:hypothetical protein